MPENVQEIDAEQIDSEAGDSGTVSENVPEIKRGGWRVEITNKGRYWTWRKGRARKRQSARGGRFSALSDERQRQYYDNVSRRAGNATKRSGVLAAKRRDISGDEQPKAKSDNDPDTSRNAMVLDVQRSKTV